MIVERCSFLLDGYGAKKGFCDTTTTAIDVFFCPVLLDDACFPARPSQDSFDRFVVLRRLTVLHLLSGHESFTTLARLSLVVLSISTITLRCLDFDDHGN